MPLLLLLRSFNLACRSVIIMCVVLRQKARRTERPVGIRTVVVLTVSLKYGSFVDLCF